MEPLDLELAKLAGALCGHTGTGELVDASVVLVARQHHAKIVTSDRSDLERLDSAVDVIPC